MDKQRKETKLNLHWHETAFRGYDPQLGRFHQIDPLADYIGGITPYQFGFDNPVFFNDPTGLAAQDSAAAPTPRPAPEPAPKPITTLFVVELKHSGLPPRFSTAFSKQISD
ncbi:MAG: hypothetical protein OHK0057_33860 [Thermoflexibacter sp.]